METTQERDDLLKIVADERRNFLYTVEGITDEQAATRTTVSELTLGGLVKHVAGLQGDWLTVLDGKVPDIDPDQRTMTESETLAGLLDAFHAACAAFDQAVSEEPDLDRRTTLPRDWWSPPKTVVWTVRHVLLHVLRELAHHAGHADIIREALDGASTTARREAAEADGERGA
jgi:uncharacterized damage-inducible protein DinB